MGDWMELFTNGDAGFSSISTETVVLALLLSFCIGHIIGWVYMATHIGLSYSQMFVASLVVIPALVALVMALMAGDVVVAFGLLALVAVVRFRNVLKDTRDTTFVLWSIVEGMAVGTLRFSTALLGAAESPSRTGYRSVAAVVTATMLPRLARRCGSAADTTAKKATASCAI